MPKVLLVDDHELIRESVQIFLKTMGVEIATAKGGADCLQQLEEGFRGIILMDVLMPRMDGFDTIEQIVARGLYPGNSIIMLTAFDEPDHRLAELSQYISDYVAKPFHPTALLDVVRHHWELLQAGDPPAD